MRTSRILLIALCAVAVQLGVDGSRAFVRDPVLEDMTAAARLAKRAMEILKEESVKRGIAIDHGTDPNETGLIGAEYSDLTTTLGSLESKRTSTNPNFAGIVVEMLHRAGAKQGEQVAVSLSGSFPALNVAVFSALQVLKLRPILISSVGASAYGANDPEWTWLDMERSLREREVFPYASRAASLGGIAEGGGGLGEHGILMGLAAIHRNGVRHLDERGSATLGNDIKIHVSLYESELGREKLAAFINVGGSLTSLGECRDAGSLPVGLVLKLPRSTCPGRGLISQMAEKGVPVIHLLNIRRIATRYGLPVDPIPLPPVPDGKAMRPGKYSLPVVLTGLVVLLAALSLEFRKKD
ncbi:MAG: poly-gamma-glutamate system protein [Candidatus Tectomicrobia bacterium]|uniref:Poly-gamma-glutamate system protein n=1 Tax=Tectimicrobiota bacterium TaxID=2528274 RepID=A0A932GT17_UNCTE|nr:poly-gamma-glutamate system protein [Candidatus Tectomicrobia bacterium]